eukprot:COSAG04_NODE_175_length_21521_cov_167.404071_18_plen_185_part_00
MVGHMADVILMPKPGDSRGKARLFTDVPVAYARYEIWTENWPTYFQNILAYFGEIWHILGRFCYVLGVFEDAFGREHLIPPDRAAMIVTFEYGPKKPGDERPSSSMPGRDVFRQARTPFAPGNGAWVGVSEFLHPVFRFHFPVRAANILHCVFQRSNWISRHVIVPNPTVSLGIWSAFSKDSQR